MPTQRPPMHPALVVLLVMLSILVAVALLLAGAAILQRTLAT